MKRMQKEIFYLFFLILMEEGKMKD